MIVIDLVLSPQKGVLSECEGRRTVIEPGEVCLGQEVVGGEEVLTFCLAAVEWIALLPLGFYLQSRRFINIWVRGVNLNVKVVLRVTPISLIYLQCLFIFISWGLFSLLGMILRSFFGSFPLHPSVLKPDFHLFYQTVETTHLL